MWHQILKLKKKFWGVQKVAFDGPPAAAGLGNGMLDWLCKVRLVI